MTLGLTGDARPLLSFGDHSARQTCVAFWILLDCLCPFQTLTRLVSGAILQGAGGVSTGFLSDSVKFIPSDIQAQITDIVVVWWKAIIVLITAKV